MVGCRHLRGGRGREVLAISEPNSSKQNPKCSPHPPKRGRVGSCVPSGLRSGAAAHPQTQQVLSLPPEKGGFPNICTHLWISVLAFGSSRCNTGLIYLG